MFALCRPLEKGVSNGTRGNGRCSKGPEIFISFHFPRPRPSFRELKLRPRGVSRIGCQNEIARVSGPQFRTYFTGDNNKTEMEIRYNLGPDRERKCTTSFFFASSSQGDMRAKEAETDSFQQNLGKKCILTSL